ncbi:Copper transport protein CTR2 [Sphaceloma murrayae]|uniref:Copper transport protein n=1 Tax=Sphaceloma murrayae TaxID=2082308 RepID=A0A2K1QZ60_9PEZI|nr:Copper transport protein CTR2 [Sphaceloma murrayae]
MDHGGMDHGGHGGMDHGDMDMGKCSMNMLFTWSTKNLCIVFEGWRVTGTVSLVFSLLAIVALTAGYELVRDMSRRYETSVAGGKDLPRRSTSQDEQRTKIVKAAFYAVQVFYSFFIMLLFMTYNGWIMLSVAVGAFVGYLMFGGSSATKSVACH